MGFVTNASFIGKKCVGVYCMKVISAILLPPYKLQVSFEDGVTGVINLEALVQKGVFTVLKDEQFFNQVKYNKSAIFWNDDLEIDLLNIYAQLGNKDLEEMFANYKYASN